MIELCPKKLSLPDKCLNYPECAQLCVVYCSVHETCAKRFFLRNSVAFCSAYIPGRKKLRTMDRKGRFNDTPVPLVQNVHRFASCPIGQVMLHSSALCPYSMKAKDVKSTVSVLFASLCIKDLELRWAAPWSNCKQCHALWTNNKVSMTNVQNVNCCASNSVVLPLVEVMQHATSVWKHMRKAKDENCTVSVFLKALWTLELKPTGDVKWSNCVQIHVIHKKQSFLDTKIWIVHNAQNSVSCSAVSMKYVQRGSSCTIVSPFVHHTSLAEGIPKNTVNMIFSVYFPYLCAELVQPRFACPYANCKQSYAFCTWNDVSMTPVKLLQNMHRFASCAIGLHSSD